ncbi:MAG: DUF2927 domain-containing protein [Microgenomates group bacterium]
MRQFQLFAVVALTACGLPQSGEVSKNSSNDSLIGLTVAAQGLVGGVARAPQRSNADLAQDFLNLEFKLESGRNLATLTRFEGPIKVVMTGDVPASAQGDLARLLTRLRREAGLDISQGNGLENASVVVEFVARAEMHRVVPNAACFVVPQVQTFASYKRARSSAQTDWAQVRNRKRAAVFIPSDTSAQEVRDCLHEELAQALGPLNDLYHLPDSVFNDDNFNTVLTGFDMMILRLHYAPELTNGSSKAEVAAILPQLMARVNPQGQGPMTPVKSIAPQRWVTAVETALGARATAAVRIDAANQMIDIAQSSGWTDIRSAFGYYARGRANVARDPAQAVQDFELSRRIYQSLQDTEIQVAHVDMQLAAVALASGQPARAIALADQATPAILHSENAALLATVMLIKAQALEASGHDAAARALRLDSLGLARYGFGSDQRVRARMNEISALGASGKRR